MSINWVMLHETQGFVRLPKEALISQPFKRIAFSLTTPSSYPAQNPLSIHSGSGTLFLTNQRIVYLPEKSSTQLQSFSAPLLNLHDTHITFPWFGPNAWQALVQPVPGGNIPAGHASIELKLTFKEGGAPDFHSNFERIKERLQQALETSVTEDGSGATGRRPNEYMVGVNLEAVHLDQLPTYEASGHDRVAPVPEVNSNMNPDRPPNTEQQSESRSSAEPQLRRQEQPADAPPGYEETQMNSLQAQLDRSLDR